MAPIMCRGSLAIPADTADNVADGNIEMAFGVKCR